MIFTRVEARSSVLDLQHQPSLARLESLRARCSGGEGGPGDCAIRQRRESAGVPAHSSRLLQHRWPRVCCVLRDCGPNLWESGVANSREFWLDTESLDGSREASKGWAWRVGGCADQAGDRERRARSRFSEAGEGGGGVIKFSRFSEAGEGGGGVIKIANILGLGMCRGCEARRSEAEGTSQWQAAGHALVSGGDRWLCHLRPAGLLPRERERASEEGRHQF